MQAPTSIPPEARDPGVGEPRLRRAITGPLLFLFILGDVLGAGVYALVGKIAGEVGGAIWLPLLVALGFAVLTAASYAELVTKYPKAGGAAVFAARAFKRPLLSFLVGFCMLSAGVTSAAGLSLAFAGDYLGAIVDLPVLPAALGFLLLIAALNARGIRESVGANVFMTVIEVTGLLLVVVLAAMFLTAGQGAPERVLQFGPAVSPAAGVLGAALLAFYSFVGFEVSANVAEEVRDVSRVYPRALFGALFAAGAIYMLVGLAASVVLPPDMLASSSAPLLDVVRATDYGVPPRLFAFVALTAVANGALLTKTVVLLLLLVFIATNAAVLVLRRDPVAQPHFRTPTALPVLASMSCLVLLSQQSAGTWVRAGLLLAAGAVLHVAMRGRLGRAQGDLPVRRGV